jgi:hypothetical protein
LAERRSRTPKIKAKLSEDERTKAELKDAQEQLAERDRRDIVKEAAEKAGVKNPRLFYNAYKDDLETDAKGKITNLKEVLEAAKTESPELFSTVEKPAGSADGGQGNGSQPTDLYTKDQLGKLSESEINANWDKVQKSLAALNKTTHPKFYVEQFYSYHLERPDPVRAQEIAGLRPVECCQSRL